MEKDIRIENSQSTIKVNFWNFLLGLILKLGFNRKLRTQTNFDKIEASFIYNENRNLTIKTEVSVGKKISNTC